MGAILRRYVLPVGVVTLFYFGLLVYPVVRIWMLLLPPPGTPELLVIMVGPLLLRLAAEIVPGGAGRWLAAAALTWLGVCFLALTIVAPWELLRLLAPMEPRTWGLVLLGLVSGLALYGFVNAQRLGVKELDVEAPPELADRVGGLRLAHISDVHIGSRQPGFLRRVIARVNRQNPDYVLITGDLIDFRGITRAALEPLATLAAPTYFIIGNHERYVDLDDICERLESLGVVVLRNRSVSVGPLQIVGIDDADARDQVRKQLAALDPEAGQFRILLYHRPDGAEDAAAWGAHLMLCGHTHNGQIVPFNYLVRRFFPRILGEYRIGQLKLYVSPGTGTWGPVLRLGSRSEIGMISLSPAVPVGSNL